MLWQRNVQEIMFYFVEESKLVSQSSSFQPSMSSRYVTLVVRL